MTFYEQLSMNQMFDELLMYIISNLYRVGFENPHFMDKITEVQQD